MKISNKMFVVPFAILYLLLIYFWYTYQNRNAYKIENLYFFEIGTTSVEYNGYFLPLSGNITEQKITLNISLLKSFEDGSLYALTLTPLDASDEFDKMPLGREHLGFFYVTKEVIYRMPLSFYDETKTYENFISFENDRNIENLENNKYEYLGLSDIVCAENGTKDEVIDNEWHKYVDVDGDKRIFNFYSDYSSGTRYYEKIVWEKGKGIIYYKSGYGSMLTHIEFATKILEE